MTDQDRVYLQVLSNVLLLSEGSLQVGLLCQHFLHIMQASLLVFLQLGCADCHCLLDLAQHLSPQLQNIDNITFIQRHTCMHVPKA